MRDNNLELAKLLGWRVWQGAWKEPRVVFGNGKSISLEFDTEWNAMAEVWKALYNRGLWDEFLFEWVKDREVPNLYTSDMPPKMGFNTIHALLNDLSGQVFAACHVLRDQAAA